MKLFITLSKKTLCVILALFIITLIVTVQLFSLNTGGINGSTNAERISFVTGLGIEVNETAVGIKEITIPDEFSYTYIKYNKLQSLGGFDLSRHKGKKAELYTYRYKNNDTVIVNLIVLDGKIIGGDITDLTPDGEMTALLPTERK